MYLEGYVLHGRSHVVHGRGGGGGRGPAVLAGDPGAARVRELDQRAARGDAERAAAAAAQEVAAGGARRGGRGRHVARGGVHAGLRAPRGGAPHAGRVGEAARQPAALPRQSASQGLVLPPAAGDPGAVHQHLARHHVLQAADVAAGGARAPSVLRNTLLYIF